MINALVNQSGKKGLSAFFPDKDVVVPNATVDLEVAHLPLTPNWRDTDFSLEAVTKGNGKAVDLNLRIWGMKMLSRYPYVTGESRLYEETRIRRSTILTCTFQATPPRISSHSITRSRLARR